MKYFYSLIFILFLFYGNSQTYYPTGTDSTSFYISCVATDVTPPYTYWVEQFTYSGDTIIKGKTYVKCYNNYNQLDTNYNVISLSFNYTYLFAVRDSAKQVFFMLNNDSVERMLFDFSINVGDTMNHYPDINASSPIISVLTSIDSFLVRYPISHYRKRYNYSGQFGVSSNFIEGLEFRFLGYPINPIRTSSCELTCIQQESDFIYKLCDTCDCYSILDKHRKLIIEENSLEEIIVYPNPFSDIINVDFKTNKTDGLIKLFGISGRKILEKKINQDKSININLSKLPSGVYIVSLETNGEMRFAKIVKE